MNKQRIIPTTLVVETGLKTSTLQRLWHCILKISLNKSRNQNYKYIHGIVKKSMRTIQLKLFNAVLKHEIKESNKETFNED